MKEYNQLLTKPDETTKGEKPKPPVKSVSEGSKGRVSKGFIEQMLQIVNGSKKKEAEKKNENPRKITVKRKKLGSDLM